MKRLGIKRETNKSYLCQLVESCIVNNKKLKFLNFENAISWSFLIDCQKNCTSWFKSQHFQKDGNCSVLEKRNCNDSVEINKLEFRERTFGRSINFMLKSNVKLYCL